MKALVVFLISVCIGIAADAQSIVWETVHPRPGLPTLRCVSFGEGIFVAAGDGGVYFSEDDGWTWRAGTNSLPGNYAAVTFANGLFVAVGNSTNILVSDDGKSWESHAISANNGLLSVIYGNGQFVAAGQGGLIATSADGGTWTVRSTPTTMSLSMLAYGNGAFVATDGVTSGFLPELYGSQLRFLTSTDGSQWSEVTVTLPFVNPACVPHPPGILCKYFEGLTGLIFAEGQFITIGRYLGQFIGSYDTKALTSANGTNWTVLTASAAGSANLLNFDSQNTLYRVNELCFHLTTLFMATNLNEWSPTPLPYSGPELFGTIPRSLHSLAYGNSTYVFVGDVDGWARIARGTNLSNQERLDSPQAFSIPKGLAARGSTIVTVDATQSLTVSTNAGFSFNSVTLPSGSGALLSVHSGQEKFVAVGKGGTILRSSDGVSWSKRLSNTSRDLNGIIFGNSQWVGVGQNGVIVTSPDASFFTLQSSGTEVALRAVVFGGGFFITVGDSGAILRSQDGQNWTIFGTDEALDLYGVAYGSGRFVATGTNGIVHTSTNGISWSSTSISGASSLSDVAFMDGVFLAISSSQTAYISTNGLDWAPISFPKPVYGTDSSDGALWAVGGAGQSMYVAKAHSQAPPALFALRAAINASGQFTLSFVPPSPGDYSILSAARITDSWQLTALLTNVSSLTTWTNLTPTESARYYVVRKN